MSHTRMPTESRPGHVAIIAGFYEDVSAVTKGWKENPVDFDSVFNQSRHTYSYGSPDILPMFSDGASDPDRVDAVMYGHEFEDFTKSSIELDAFVFNHLDDLFNAAKTDKQLAERLHQDKLVFFLHLLGIDTAGHSYRPYSAEYYDNIKYIDSKIEQLEKTVNSFYDDDNTAWVFTADHGMSDWGSHGDGAPDNTRTPLVAWGAGINKPVHGGTGHDDFSEEWGFGDISRHDVNQADIASLMSYLVGLNFPANSVGELPLEYISASDSVKSEAIQANSYAIVEQYLVKETERKSAQLRFVPFEPLQNLTERKLEIDTLRSSGDHAKAIEKSEELMLLGLQGLRYLQTYNWLFLRSLVSVGFVGWIGYAFTSFLYLFMVSDEERSRSNSWTPYIRSVSVAVFSILVALMFYQKSSWNHYLYAFFPVFFWDALLENWSIFKLGSYRLVHNSQQFSSPLKGTIAMIVLAVGLLEAIVVGYFRRETFSFVFFIAAFWPWIQDGKIAVKHIWLCAIWGVLCFILASFTLLSAVKVEDIFQITVGGVLMTLVGLYCTVVVLAPQLSMYTLIVFGLQLGLIPLSVIVTRSSCFSLQAREGLPFGNQVIGWAVVILSQLLPFLHYWSTETDYRVRVLTIFLAFSPIYVILTISYEGLFYLAFCAILVVWIELESIFRQNHKPGVLSLDDFRISLFFFFLSQVGFFGTGNIASISSFSLDSVYRLIPIFDPFSMTAILLYKILIPFAVLSAMLGIQNLRLHLATYALFAMVLSVSDILTLNFFYLVVDEGSWLDIGTGICNFTISCMLCLFMILLEYLSGVLTSGVSVPGNKVGKKD